MQKLIDKLIELETKYSIEENFKWDIPNSVPIEIPSSIQNIYRKNIYLKKHFALELSNDEHLKNHYWIIQEWGGIKPFKKNEKNDEKIIKFKSQLNEGILTTDTFDRISSFSKIASFLNPEKYAIYDSRAIYSLNWLLFNYTDVKELYPQPLGRNKELIKYDMQTIIRLSKKKHSYKSHKKAYHHYCNFLIELSKKVYNDSRPYQVEMLLFLIAPNEIINMIESNVEINIKDV